MTDNEIRLTIGLVVCGAVLCGIYFAAWLYERYRGKDGT